MFVQAAVFPPLRSAWPQIPRPRGGGGVRPGQVASGGRRVNAPCHSSSVDATAAAGTGVASLCINNKNPAPPLQNLTAVKPGVGIADRAGPGMLLDGLGTSGNGTVRGRRHPRLSPRTDQQNRRTVPRPCAAGVRACAARGGRRLHAGRDLIQRTLSQFGQDPDGLKGAAYPRRCGAPGVHPLPSFRDQRQPGVCRSVSNGHSAHNRFEVSGGSSGPRTLQAGQ